MRILKPNSDRRDVTDWESYYADYPEDCKVNRITLLMLQSQTIRNVHLVDEVALCCVKS